MKCLILKLMNCVCITLSMALACPGSLSAQNLAHGIAMGTIIDSLSGEPIGRATVRVAESPLSMAANDDGEFRLRLPVGEHRLLISHVGYHSVERTVRITDSGSETVASVRMIPLAVVLAPISVFPDGGNPADEIIRQAIARKQEILNRVDDYVCNAYTKLVLEDAEKDSAERMFLITETQSTVYWRKPNDYKEVITARRQTENIAPEENLVAVGGIDNFNGNRVELGEYSVVAPTAEDALNYYRFRLIDTVQIDDRPIYVIELEPRNPNKALFVGRIEIVDSTFDVVAVDVGASAGLVFPLMEKIRYQQRLSPVMGSYWLPAEVLFSGIVKFKTPIPGVPQKIVIDYSSSFHSYLVDLAPDEVFDEFALEVAQDADDVDSSFWDSQQFVPLTGAELAAYHRIDSVNAAPKPLGKVLGQAGLFAGLVAVGAVQAPPELFRFNRVEGPYLGMAVKPALFSQRLRLHLGSGYSFSTERIEQDFRGEYRFGGREDVRFGALYHNRYVRRPTVVSTMRDNPTYLALVSQLDPFDYYREKGARAWLSFKPLAKTRIRFEFSDLRQNSAIVNSDFSVFENREVGLRENSPILPGKLRSAGVSFHYDSRRLIKNKGKESALSEPVFTLFSLNAELSDPDVLGGDFDYRRYSARIVRRQRSLGVGLTTFTAFAGFSERALPPQRYFTVDYGNSIFQDNFSFATLDQHNFVGSRAFAFYANHDFDHKFLARTGIPLIEKIPFTLSLHGGAFWADFQGLAGSQFDTGARVAKKPYGEAGFGIGNLTPFIAPFNLAVWVTWQVSSYDTDRFSSRLGVRF